MRVESVASGALPDDVLGVPIVVDGVAKEKLDTQTTVRLVYTLF